MTTRIFKPTQIEKVTITKVTGTIVYKVGEILPEKVKFDWAPGEKSQEDTKKEMDKFVVSAIELDMDINDIAYRVWGPDDQLLAHLFPGNAPCLVEYFHFAEKKPDKEDPPRERKILGGNVYKKGDGSVQKSPWYYEVFTRLRSRFGGLGDLDIDTAIEDSFASIMEKPVNQRGNMRDFPEMMYITAERLLLK